MATEDKKKQRLVSRTLLAGDRIKVRSSDGGLVFSVPEDIEKKLLTVLNFSFDKLRVGANVSLAALAAHINEHAAQEAYIGAECEKIRYALECAKVRMKLWEEECYHNKRAEMTGGDLKLKPTERQISAAIHSDKKMRDEYLSIQRVLLSLEMKYRLLNNVVRSALQTKGELLPTLRNLVQGKSQHMEPVEPDEEEAEKIRLGEI